MGLVIHQATLEERRLRGIAQRKQEGILLMELQKPKVLIHILAKDKEKILPE